MSTLSAALVASGLVLILLPSLASALGPAVEYSLRDGPLPDGVADDLILPPDPNYGRIFQSTLFDAEFYVEFPLAGTTTEDEVRLLLRVAATDVDLVLGESKTFRLSSYPGTGVASLASFGLGTALDTIVLPSNGSWELEVDVTDVWNDAVLAGDDFLGIRLHDPVWTGSAVGAGTIIYGSAELLPEPGADSLAATALLGLCLLVRIRGSTRTPSRRPGAEPRCPASPALRPARAGCRRPGS